jgi:hypothetical protein
MEDTNETEPKINIEEPEIIEERESLPTEKEIITESLEQRSIGTPDQSSVNLEFGDIIEIMAPTHPEIDEMVAIITYIDNQKITLVNVANYQHYKLTINEDGTFTDESIVQINILSRSKEKGYARQNGLLSGIWIDVHFGGDIPAIITGEITNLEGDMIELTTFPELRTIYINFGYKGLPDNIPIDKIAIRQKPAAVTVPTLAMLRGVPEAAGDLEEGEIQEGAESSIEYTESGESIITVPKDVVAERNVRDQLHDLYMEASNEIVFGEKLGEIYQLVEIPEENQRFGIDVQVNDMMDEILSTIPNSQRTKSVLDNIHLLIERYKQLRINFSKFDKNGNSYDVKVLGTSHKPLVDHLHNMDRKLRWLVPVVVNRRKLYDVGIEIDSTETITETLGSSLRQLEKKQLDYYKGNSSDPLLQYNAMCGEIQESLTPFSTPLGPESYLHSGSIGENLDSIVANLEDFYSTVFTKSGIAKRQYIIQRYNLGFSGLESETMKTGKTVFLSTNITPNDSMTVRSILMMPEPVIRFSAVNLPGTNILERANLGHHDFMFYRFLKRRLEIQPHTINDLSKEVDYEKMEKDSDKSIFSDVHEFFLGNDVVDEDKFHKFLEVVVPKTRFLIRLIRKYLKDNLSFLDVVKQLEPFMVYSSDITYKQYLEIRFALKERIEELKQSIEKRSGEYSALRNAKFSFSPLPDPLLRIVSENKSYADSFFKAYEFLDKTKDKKRTIPLSSGEELNNMNSIDNGSLYTNIMTSIMISLMTPNQLMDALSEPKLDDLSENEKIKAADCARKYLAKRYTSIKEMQKDNSQDELYFEKELDDTPYSIMKKYEKQQKEMLPDLFMEMLQQSLIDKHDCPPSQAPSLAETLIAGKKKVMDGDYAMLELRPTLPSTMDENDLSEMEKAAVELEADIRKRVQYYRRMKGNWVKDNDIAEESFLDTSSLFCNMSKDCYKNKTNSVCESKDETTERAKQLVRKKMMEEFDKRYSVNVEELEKELEMNINQKLKLLKKQYDLRDIQLRKVSRLSYSIGMLASQNEILSSPYLHWRDLILGQSDFSKKQADICRFVLQYCRDPLVEQQEESPHWKYCKETNTKLFPFSLYQLARAFIMGANYTQKLASVCAKFGVISDDGDAVVDKYSGFVLRKVDFSTEEGFGESGFRITTNAVMEEDLGAILLDNAKNVSEKRVFENETAEIVFNVVSTICRNIDIPLAAVEEVVMRNSLEMFDKIIYTEASYQKKSDKQLKDKGKPLQPYRNYRDETRLVIIACNLLIAVQIAIPSIQSKRTFPGCVRSFSGFPLSAGIEDITGIQYLACILHKTTSSIAIWESIKKYKPDVLVKRMKDIFDNFIMKRSDIMEMYIKKREYMVLYPEMVAPQEHNIKKWQHFLPPVVPFTLPKTLQNVSRDFEEDLKALIRKGSKEQTESINVLKSKMLFFGYGIIESIQKIVEKKDVILKTSGNLPFLENACCNESLELTNPLQYFYQENDQIVDYIRNVLALSKLWNMTKDAAKAPLFFHNEFTGIRHSTIYSNNLDDVELIYSAIIHYCNFDKNLPIPEKFKGICNEIPAGYQSIWTIQEKIEFLKNNAVQYNVDNLLHMMNLVNRENLVDLDSGIPFTRVNVVKEVIEDLDMEDSKVVDEPLRQLMFKLLEAYKPKTMAYDVSNELNDLQNYLLKANKDMYREIMDFFGRYGNMSDRKYSQLNDFLKNVCNWKLDKPMKETGLYYDSGLYTVTQYVQNAVQSMCKTYPNILLNNVGFYKKVPAHWGFSDKHNSVLLQAMTKYYEKMEEFKGDRIIYRLLQEVSVRLVGLNVFLQNLPIHTEMVKDLGENVEGERVRSFYHLMDKPTIYMLYSYCFYSVLYEYINCTNDIDMLRADIEEVKRVKRNELRDMGDATLQVGGELEDIDTSENELVDVEIRLGNTEELKIRVASLLLCFLEIEDENKKVLDLNYEDILRKTRRNKDMERSSVVERLGRMSIEHRKGEDMLKKFRLEHWNVGQQKGLYEYDGQTYDRELEQFLMGGEEEEVVVPGNADSNQLDADDAQAVAAFEAVDYDRGGIMLGNINIGDDRRDGDYYYDDTEMDEFPEE